MMALRTRHKIRTLSPYAPVAFLRAVRDLLYALANAALFVAKLTPSDGWGGGGGQRRVHAMQARRRGGCAASCLCHCAAQGPSLWTPLTLKTGHNRQGLGFRMGEMPRALHQAHSTEGQPRH